MSVASVTLWLSIVTEYRWNPAGELWTVTREMPHLPSIGDDIILWPSKELEPTDGPFWQVCKRFWDANGHAHLELAKMVLDASEEDHQLWIQRGMDNIQSGRLAGHQGWSSAYDGDPRPSLIRGRWRKHLGGE